jgi:hypothetical protein
MIASQQQQIAETHAALHQAKQQAQTELAAVQNKWQSLQAVCSAREAELAQVRTLVCSRFPAFGRSSQIDFHKASIAHVPTQVRQQLDVADTERTAMRAKQVEAAATVATLRAELVHWPAIAQLIF